MKKQTKQWLIFADEDLRVAKIVFKEGIYNQVCFHSQQATEKSLKALIEE
ncbi:MAG: HEPN domain-containing protein, partial [Candidatus Omnitrophota bacterium]